MIENTQDKNQSAEERSQDTQRFVRQVKSSHSQEIHRRREDSHSYRRLPSRGHSQRTVPARRHQAYQFLLMDQRVHGGRQATSES